MSKSNNPLYNKYAAESVGRIIKKYEKARADFLLASYQLWETGYYDPTQSFADLPDEFESAKKQLEPKKIEE